jgi:hypothetical protein
MPASLQRKFKRKEERDRAKMIKKIHNETIKRFKGMSDEEIQNELRKYVPIHPGYMAAGPEDFTTTE